MLKTLSLPQTIKKSSVYRHERKAIRVQNNSLVPFLVLVVFMLNVYLLINYVVNVNQYSSRGYEIRNLQQKISGLTETNKKLNMQMAESSSMIKIQADFLNSNFVSAETARFVETPKFTQR